MKIEIFDFGKIQLFGNTQDIINDFINDKEVIDIKTSRNENDYPVLVVMYKD